MPLFFYKGIFFITKSAGLVGVARGRCNCCNLAGLIILNVGKRIEQFRITGCQNRLRNIGNAIQLFTNGHRGLMPGPLACVF
jgi:hypothetical protein